MAPATHVLTLPGYTGAGPQHWLTAWERLHPRILRVEQDDWERPEPAAWAARLDEMLDAVAPNRPALIAAHSLGCLVLAHWRRVSPRLARVAGALLVAPPDVERPDTPAALRCFAPVPLARLPFPSIVVAGSNDPWAAPGRAAAFARAWGSRFVDAGAVGHLDSAAGLGEWRAGWALLASLPAAADGRTHDRPTPDLPRPEPAPGPRHAADRPTADPLPEPSR